MHNTININNTNVELSTKENSIFTNTKDIAEVFGKRNADVMKAVESSIEEQDLLDLISQAKNGFI